MNLESIISVTGKPGLFKVISQIKNGLIVESLLEKKRMPIHATDKVSALSDISIYTNEGDMPLADIYEVVFKKTDGKSAVSHKAKPEELKAYMKEILPDYDEDRVYVSDLKKLFLWFNLLAENGLLVPSKDEDKDDKADAPKKTVAKKTAPKKPVVQKGAPKTRAVKGGGQTSMPSKKGS